MTRRLIALVLSGALAAIAGCSSGSSGDTSTKSKGGCALEDNNTSCRCSSEYSSSSRTTCTAADVGGGACWDNLAGFCRCSKWGCKSNTDCNCSFDAYDSYFWGTESSCQKRGSGPCCLDPTSGLCSCYATNPSCPKGDVVVAACDLSTALSGLNPYDLGGFKRVDSCHVSSGATAPGAGGGTSGAGGGGGASGAGGGAAQCSPKTGECKGGGDCACGQACFPTAVCSSCTKRCGYSCVTDEDCQKLKAQFNLTVSYSKCVKTSPNYEIYKCE